MEIVRDLRGHATFVVAVLAVLLLLPGIPDGGSLGYRQLAAASEAMPGEAKDTCVALSKTSMVAGHPRQVGEYCLVAASLGSDKLTCTPDDTMPPGVCKVHYCDPTGCHDTTMSLPSEIKSIQNGVSNGYITPDTSLNPSQIGTPTDFQNGSFNMDANSYTESTGFSPTQGAQGISGTDEIGAMNSNAGAGSVNSSNNGSLLFSSDAPAPTAEQFSQSNSFSQNSSIYQGATVTPDGTGINSVNTESATLAPNSVNVEAPTGESTFAAPKNTIDLPQTSEAPTTFWESAGNQMAEYVNDVKSFFGFPTTPGSPCPDGVCSAVGIRG